MVKKRVKEKIKKGVREIKEKVAELEELERDLEEEVVDEAGFDEGGIFDEDLEFVEGDAVSDFDIGDVMLSTAPFIESWAGKDLEEEVSRSHNEWDWQPEDKFVGGDVYNSDSSSGAYGVGSGDAYSASERGEGLYGAGAGGLYDEKSGEGKYAVQGGSPKSYADIEKDRRAGLSMLEVAGFEDKEKAKHRETHGLIKYEGRKT